MIAIPTIAIPMISIPTNAIPTIAIPTIAIPMIGTTLTAPRPVGYSPSCSAQATDHALGIPLSCPDPDALRLRYARHAHDTLFNPDSHAFFTFLPLACSCLPFPIIAIPAIAIPMIAIPTIAIPMIGTTPWRDKWLTLTQCDAAPFPLLSLSLTVSASN